MLKRKIVNMSNLKIGGTTWDVYLYILTSKSQGVRDIWRGLKLSSPSLAQYHVNKLVYYEVHSDPGSAILREKQMKKWGVKYHSLRFDKPEYDVLIDDKTENIREWE